MYVTIECPTVPQQTAINAIKAMLPRIPTVPHKNALTASSKPLNRTTPLPIRHTIIRGTMVEATTAVILPKN